jgi:hypothetical protein
MQIGVSCGIGQVLLNLKVMVYLVCSISQLTSWPPIYHGVCPLCLLHILLQCPLSCGIWFKILRQIGVQTSEVDPDDAVCMIDKSIVCLWPALLTCFAVSMRQFSCQKISMRQFLLSFDGIRRGSAGCI